jgi:hypothetical protein
MPLHHPAALTLPRRAAHRLAAMIDLRTDLRWMRLNDPLFRAGDFAGGRFDLDFDRPAEWTGGGPVGGDDPFDPDHFLSADLCVIGGARFFVRSVIELPILGGGGRSLAYALWAEVSRPGFGVYFRTLEDPQADLGATLAGTLANRIAGYESTLGQPCALRLRGGERPLATLSESAHVLAREQTRGIALDRMLDLYAAAGLDLRPALAVVH